MAAWKREMGWQRRDAFWVDKEQGVIMSTGFVFLAMMASNEKSAG
jgi:hypothetical protein